MANAAITVNIVQTGIPAYEGTPRPPIWATGSSLMSSFVGSIGAMLSATLPQPPRETVFLTRAQQRIMDRALRRSLRIIA